MASTRIRELPEDERPREKLANLGPSALSNAELLAIFLRTGIAGKSAVELARQLLRERGSLQGLARTTPAELMQFSGVKMAKATQLCAAFELGRRLVQEQIPNAVLDTPERVFEFMGPRMRALSQECVSVILLDARRGLIKVEEVTRGTINESLAHPREILRVALSHSSHSFVLVHNHPSGNPMPSSADRELTRRLFRASETVGVPLIDHIIIGAAAVDGPPYFSFREAGLL
jgi:DNA repair protein RadC